MLKKRSEKCDLDVAKIFSIQIRLGILTALLVSSFNRIVVKYLENLYQVVNTTNSIQMTHITPILRCLIFFFFNFQTSYCDDNCNITVNNKKKTRYFTIAWLLKRLN